MPRQFRHVPYDSMIQGLGQQRLDPYPWEIRELEKGPSATELKRERRWSMVEKLATVIALAGGAVGLYFSLRRGPAPHSDEDLELQPNDPDEDEIEVDWEEDLEEDEPEDDEGEG